MILDDILKYRKEQLKREMQVLGFDEMESRAEKSDIKKASFYNALKTPEMSIIAEVKKASPSKSVIKEDFHPLQQAKAYEAAGADAISCLTEEHYFMGSSKYLKEITENVKIPVLRKDFIFDPYQIYEAKVIGASAVLIIAAMLDVKTMQEFKKIADSLGLDCLFEAHDKSEIDKILKCDPKIIGINNRNLKTFELTLENSANLAKYIPKNCVFISESGVKSKDDVEYLRKCGADAVLVGETLMRSNDIKKTVSELKDVK